MISIPANVSRIAFQIPGSGVEFRVLGFTHREALSDSFCSELDLTCERPDLQLQNYLGHAATVALHHEHGVRYFHGCVAEMGQGRVGKRFHSYHAVIRPLFWQLGMRSGLRIFQDQTVPDIVKTVLNDAGIQQKDLRFDIAGAYPQRPYCCQYNETDLDFISRLLEQEGLFYYFEHQESGHCLVISDKRHSFSPIPGASAVLYRDPAGMAAPQESVYEFHCQQQLRAGAISGRDYFFEKSSLSLNAQATTGPWTSLEQHRYPGHFHQTQQGQHRVNTALGAEQQDQHRFEGKSDCPRLAAGKRVRFTDLPQDQTDSEYLLTHIEINATQPQAMEAEASDEGGSFAITFSAIPADNSYYPKQTTPYPRVVGIQTAVVTGPKGEEIYTDAHGRVKVQFHWDREGNKDQHSSCWLRVSQAWAGNQWGAFVLPRIGQEVIVRHLNGDPDQPIITGALYNQTNPPPDTLPQHKTRTVYKSQTTPGGGGYNELYLDDQKDQEQIFIHGQRDIDVYVKNDLNKTVRSDHHQIVIQDHLQEIGADLDISVGQNQNTHIGGNLNQTVGQNFTQISGQDHRLQTGADLHLKSNTDITLDAGESITLKGGGGSIVLDAMGVAINGVQVRINSGGSARGAKTTAPQKPQAPEPVNPGTSGQPLNKRAEHKHSQQTPVEFDASKFKALNQQEAEVPQQNISETNATTALEESEQNAIAYWQQAELSATNPMAAVGSRIMRLNAEAGYGIAAGAVALYETLTNKDKFIASAQGIYDTLSDPEQMYADVKQATHEFAELPPEQQGEAAYKLLVGTLATGGVGKAGKVAGKFKKGKNDSGSSFGNTAASGGVVAKSADDLIFRSDNYLHSHQGSTPGRLKSYIDDKGNLVPANPNGRATVIDHIRGSEPRKSDSPYTSFSFSQSPGKSYGDTSFSLNVKHLKADIENGSTSDVEIIDHNSLLKIHDDTIQKARMRYDNNPTAKNLERLDRAMMDRSNSVRDQEVLIKGTVPNRYLNF